MTTEKLNIETSIKELQSKFQEIKNMGYVKSIRNGPTGIGATFEFLIDKKEDRLDLPDFKEIKIKRAYSKSLINLFNASSKGQTTNEPTRIKEKYGETNGHVVSFSIAKEDLEQIYDAIDK